MSASGRVVFAVLSIGTCALSCYLMVLLWTAETPGWWFSLLFSVMLIGLALALVAVNVAAVRNGNEREVALSRWREELGDVQLFPCTVTARDAKTLEDGSVSSFDLTVSSPTGVEVQGTWRPRPGVIKGLLQTQVPGVGAHARVWRSAHSSADYPLVIEVLDPSVVPGSDDSQIPKYV